MFTHNQWSSQPTLPTMISKMKNKKWGSPIFKNEKWKMKMFDLGFFQKWKIQKFKKSIFELFQKSMIEVLNSMFERFTPSMIDFWKLQRLIFEGVKDWFFEFFIFFIKIIIFVSEYIAEQLIEYFSIYLLQIHIFKCKSCYLNIKRIIHYTTKFDGFLSFWLI